MTKRIEAEGRRDAKIVLIGESPWTQEHAVGRPFVGASGNLLERWWGRIGLLRSDIYIDNVYPFKPPPPAPIGDRLLGVETETLVHWMRDVHQRIAALDRPHVIVTTGNYATFALLGKGKVPARVYNAIGQNMSATDAEKKAGITSLRGSVYKYTDLHGREMKVVPTIHPAAVLQHVKWEARTVKDWLKIVDEAKSPKIDTLQRNLNIDPSIEDVVAFIQRAQRDVNAPVSLDIETWGNSLSCCGFALSPTDAVVLKTSNKADRKFWMPWIRALCALENAKILQNGLYDTYWLKWLGIDVKNWMYDTLCMHHCLEPTETHSLEFLTSIYSKQQYYKDEAKDAEEIRKYARNLDSLWTYNALDCAVTWEVWDAMRKEFDMRRWGFYFRHYQKMFQPLLRTMLHGVRVDKAKQKEFAKTLLAECDKLREDLKAAAGEELYATKKRSRMREPTKAEWKRLLVDDTLTDEHARYHPKNINKDARAELGYVMTKKQIREKFEVLKKDFSRIKLVRFLHEKLKIPKKVKKGKTEPTTDEVALREMIIKYPEKGQYPKMIIDHREKKREHSYVKGAWDSDGRIRCSYKLNTDAGRLASSKNPRRKGYNLQNVKRGYLRSSFVPDSGCVFVRIDMSQDEDRRVKMYTKQARMVKLANMKPWEYDAHTVNAAAIFKVSETDVTKEQRYLGKRAVHAAQRGMMGKTLSEVLLKDDYIVPMKKCQQMIDRYHEANPEITENYFPFVRETFISTGQLVNTWGRFIRFDNEVSMGRLGEDVWRKLYSFWPQSECADNLNQNGFIPGCDWMWRELGKALNAQVHDEVIASVPPERAWDFVQFLVPLLEQPREYFGARLIVPAEVTIGKDWDDDRYEFKRMPQRGEFEEVVYAVAGEVER